MKAYKESEGIAPLILNLSARSRWVVNITARLLHPPAKNPHAHWPEGLVGPQILYDQSGEEKNLLSLQGYKPRTVQPILA